MFRSRKVSAHLTHAAERVLRMLSLSAIQSMTPSATLFAALMVLSTGAFAQQPEPARKDSSKVQLETVTVVATRIPISVMRAPLAVTIIDAPKLRLTRGYGLDEALSLVPGVLAQSRYGNQDVRIVIRGFGARGAGDRSNAGTSRGIRVLLDGIPETEPDGRTSFDGIDLAAAERVDVVRSNASSIWGNAAGGVINVSTLPAFTSSRLGVEQMLGSFGLQRSVVRVGGSPGTSRAYGTFVHSDFDGWREGSSSRRNLLNTGLTAQLGERTELSVLGYYANNLFYIPGPLTQAQVDADPMQANATYFSRRERRYNRTGRLAATISHGITENQQISGMVYVNPKYLQRSERGTFRDFTRYHTGANLQYSAAGTLGSTRSQLTLGADEAYQDGAILFYGLTPGGERATDLRDNKREGANNVGIFAQEQLDLGEKVSLTLGARYDDIHYIARSFITPALNDQRNFSRVTPKVSAVYHWAPGRMLYASVGGGVEAPAGNETDPASTFGQDTVYGINPLLDAVRSTTFEVGTKHILAAHGPLQALSYDIAMYQTNVQNEIIPYRGGRFYFTAGEARRRGLEIGANALANFGLSLGAALTVSRNTYVEYRVDSVHYNPALSGHYADFAGNKIVGVPDVYGSATVGWQPETLGGFGVRFAVVRIGDYFADDGNAVRVPGYSVLNATLALGRPVSVGGGIGLRGFVSINNLADTRYIGSAFLNPDVVAGVPVAFEPGLPRNVVLSLALERIR